MPSSTDRVINGLYIKLTVEWQLVRNHLLIKQGSLGNCEVRRFFLDKENRGRRIPVGTYLLNVL